MKKKQETRSSGYVKTATPAQQAEALKKFFPRVGVPVNPGKDTRAPEQK